jgi:hypothetical protein
VVHKVFWVAVDIVDRFDEDFSCLCQTDVVWSSTLPVVHSEIDVCVLILEAPLLETHDPPPHTHTHTRARAHTRTRAQPLYTNRPFRALNCALNGLGTAAIWAWIYVHFRWRAAAVRSVEQGVICLLQWQ